jgi:predicted TIM-barrel fold metal-dependent hydrolase
MTEIYEGKLLDAMAQIEYVISSENFFEMLDKNNVSKIALFSRNGDYRQERDYSCAEKIKEDLGNTVILGTSKRFNQSVHFEDYYISELTNELQNNNPQFMGELMFSHADKHDGDSHSAQERYVDAESPTVAKLLDLVSEINPVPIMIHWEVYHWERDLASISSMIKKYPNLTFIWVHCGFADAGQVDYMLSTHPNLVATLTKREMVRIDNLWISHTGDDLGGYQIWNPEFRKSVDGAIIDNNGIIKPEWVELLTKYQDRFMWGTDAHKSLRWQSYGRIIKIWRGILSQLDVDLVKKITYDNAMRIYKVNE